MNRAERIERIMVKLMVEMYADPTHDYVIERAYSDAVKVVDYVDSQTSREAIERNEREDRYREALTQIAACDNGEGYMPELAKEALK